MFSIALTKTRNDLKRPTTSKKQPETTWNSLEEERQNMMRPIVSKKQSEMICNKQGSTWNDLHRTDSKFMEPLYLKNNKLEGSNVTKKQ